MNPFAKSVGIKEKEPLVQLDLEGKYIKTFSSIKEAVTAINCRGGNMYAMLIGRQGKVGEHVYVKEALYDKNKDYSYNEFLKRRQRELRIKRIKANAAKQK